jgi:hypothetical protein
MFQSGCWCTEQNRGRLTEHERDVIVSLGEISLFGCIKRNIPALKDKSLTLVYSCPKRIVTVQNRSKVGRYNYLLSRSDLRHL